MNSADEPPSLAFMESSLLTLCLAESKLAEDLTLYRTTMTPLLQAVALQVMGNAPSHHFIRQLLADSYLAQEHMAKAVRHAGLAYDAATAMRRRLV
jgi:hypothetical protein